ncbi:MAG: Sir2 family NAD-dependent protein deacetylase [Pseudomonadota bacterium]
MEPLHAAADFIRQADGLLITAGAGIGVDSGLPDFRGNQGFWKAYPPLAKAGIEFTAIASPVAFRDDPALAWGFYGHRLQLYRDTVPHEGFAILLEMAARMEKGCFVFTSNVDGQFQKADFDPERLVECHGSIHHLQCMNACTSAIWPADDVAPVVDHARCRMVSEMPRCPHCGELARPNILMFNDGDWVPDRMEMQHARLQTWVSSVQRPVVIESGAGTAIPSVRRLGEVFKAPLIRINPRESEVHRGSDIALPTGALNGLRMLQAELAGMA